MCSEEFGGEGVARRRDEDRDFTLVVEVCERSGDWELRKEQPSAWMRR